MKRIFFSMMLLFAACSLVGGCASQEPDGTIKPLNAKTADSLSAEHSAFENSEDPPFTAETRFAAGQLAESQGAPQRAVLQYEEALKINPQMLPAAYRIGVAYTQMRDFPKAIAAWERYMKLTDGSATAYANLGFCYEVAGQVPQATATYEQGIAKDPKNEPCRINFGLMLARTGKPEQAMEQLTAVLTPAEAHYNIGSVYEQQHRVDLARSEYAKALELDPGMWEAQQRMQALNK